MRDPRPAPTQLGLERLPDDGWDAVVVGAGPAGSTAARQLAAAGRRVLLLDRRRFPRDKTCGDALIPDAQASLARAGLLDRVRALAWAGDRGEVHSPSGVRVEVPCRVLTLPRRLLDATLAEGAIEAGATFGCAVVERVEDEGAGGVAVHVAGRASPLRAPIGILATGAHVALVERAGLLERRRASAVALRCYLRSTHRIDRLVISFDRAVLPGYAWIFPLGADGAGAWRYNVGVGLVLGPRDADEEPPALRAMLGRFLAGSPAGRALVAGEVAREVPRGALLRSGLTGARPWSGGAVLVVGEAIGTTFPLTGEGIGKAMETGELAADAALGALRAGATDALAAYPAALASGLRPRYRGYAVAERWFRRPWLADLLLRRAAARPRVNAALAAILDESLDATRVFSLRGMARTLVG